IDQLRDTIDTQLLSLAIAPVVIYALHVTQSYLFGVAESTFRTLCSVLAGVAVVSWSVWRVLVASKRLDRLLIGLDAEIAVGQELDQLMSEGARVFHDVPAEGFNVDHVVICAAGVYAIETKGRAKPIRGRGKADARVNFDGAVLRFPTWTERQPAAQARRQARWLQEWLSKAVGAPVAARPVLAIPGWWIDRPEHEPFLIYNGKKPQFLLKPRGESLPAQLRQQIAHQLEQRCRSVKPHYSK
ncbi:MAG TPA: nuclease-related domain-containing protein, partial [Povalibacter sp.]|uniref:nuclease-related domain-containing protein n=1 Tax=Povalibacter sp. TaxID=1962978 RepID=UPI002C3A5DA7